jgi:hypothetical protein
MYLQRLHMFRQINFHPQGINARYVRHKKSDKLVATQNEHKRRTSMLSLGSEPAIPAIERMLIYALESTVTGIGVRKV